MTSDALAQSAGLRDHGFALLEAGKVAEAEAALRRARTLNPGDPLVHFRLALVFVDTGRPADALASLDQSLVLDPSSARAHNNRGTALQILGRMQEAEASFRRALDLAPDLTQPYINLGYLLEQRGEARNAAALYERAMARGLDAAVFGHHLAAALGMKAARAPDEWVRSTFDNFAPTFETHLRSIGYDAPERLASMLSAHVPGHADIVDLGCGTGLCGVALEGIKRRLTGVDLSPKMITQARVHGVYDELDLAEVGAWLAGAPSCCADVVIAADVFIYIGALESVFREVARILRPGGWFAFSIEELPGGGYALLPSGRFAHSHESIERLARASFAIVAADRTVIRTEMGIPLGGRLYLLRLR